MHTPWVTMQVYLAKVNWGTYLFVSLGYITEAQHQSRHNRPYHLCLSNQRRISVFVPAKHTKMKEKLNPYAPGYHVSKKNYTTEVAGLNKNSPSIVLTGCPCCHHFSICSPMQQQELTRPKRKAGSHANTWNMYGQFSIDNNKHKGNLKTCQ